jgi:hypothetical protein
MKISKRAALNSIAWPKDSAQRVSKGFASRLGEALALRLGEPGVVSTVGNSVFASFVKECGRKSDPLASSEIDKRWLSISAAINSTSVALQDSILKSISEPLDLPLAEAFAVGFSFARRKLSIAEVIASADEDFSILVESAARFGSALPPDLRDEIIEQSREFARKVSSAPTKVGTWQEPALDFLKLGTLQPGSESTGLSALQEAAAAAKRQAIHIVGPDLFSLLQGLADPSEKLSPARLDAASTLMREWGLSKTFACLLAARSLIADRHERAFLKANLANIADGSLSLAAQQSLARIVAGKPQARRPAPRSRDYADKVVAAYEWLAAGLKTREPTTVLSAIVEIYCIDRALVGFLDWNKIVEIAKNTYFITPEAAFVTMLIDTEYVRNRYPEESKAMGTGALVVDVMQLFSTSRRHQELPTLMKQIQKLPAPAASALSEAVLDRAILERLAELLPTPKSWPQGSPIDDRSRLHSLRIEALRLAETRGLLTKDYVDKQIELESDQIRMHYFQHRMRRGRVRITKDEIRRTAKEVTEDFIPMNLLRLPRGAADYLQGVIARLASYVADQLADTILFDSTASVDQALSSNLRHGIVLSRILRAFDDAFHTVEKSIPEWEEAKLSTIFGKSSDRILGFRSFVSKTIKAFIQTTLTVDRDGDLHNAFRLEVAAAIEDHVSGGGTGTVTLERAVERGALRAIGNALSEAGNVLTTQVKPLLLEELMSVRTYTQEWVRANRDTVTFIDFLDTSLREACEEVRHWIAIAEDEGDPISFRLREVVNLELRTHYSSGHLRVTVGCYRDGKPSDFAIRGQYLNVFHELINNLLSNAFKHSGEEFKTEIEISLYVSKEVRLRCVNSISQGKVAEIQANQDRTRALARHSVGRGARLDALSGFQKMRLAVSRGLKSEAIMNIPPISEKRAQFVVEIIVREAPEIIDDQG